jgi:hypothetical protein
MKEQSRKYSRNDQNLIFDFIGKGELGGKAAGLAAIQQVLEARFPTDADQQISVSIPHMTVLRTEVFTEFMQQNDLYPLALSNADDNYLAHVFQKASLPPAIVGDLRDLIAKADKPLAVRSSSLLEDSSNEPFAGVYATKMLPNNQKEVETRFHQLTQAIKFIYSSLFFSDSKDYFRITGKDLREEKMAVIIQNVVGNRYEDYYYPLISGVGRTYNYYPQENTARTDGVVNLALGLGKTIVDGYNSWIYCPRQPGKPAPFNSIKELLDNSQREFWSVKMGSIQQFNPVSEIEFMQKLPLDQAEADRNLELLASTYDHENDRIIAGIQQRGARLLDFAPVLKYKKIELNNTIIKLLEVCKEYYEADVEIEFALERREDRFHLGFLQVRTMQILSSSSAIAIENFKPQELLAISNSVLGNGRRQDIMDVVYVKPDGYDARNNRETASQIARINRQIAGENKPYLLIGFGRWGSSDPWLGIPVTWSMISAARTIIEAALPQMKPDLSQGSHFFHNLIAFGVFYLSISDENKKNIDWNWLDRQEIISETEFVKHVRCPQKLEIIVDSASNKGVILK